MAQPVPLLCVQQDGLAAANLTPAQRLWAEANDFTGQRGRLVRMIKGGGSKAPRYGPRSEMRDIRNI